MPKLRDERRDGDIENVQAILVARPINASHIAAASANDFVRRLRMRFAIPDGLGVELHLDECMFLFRRPGR